MVVTWWIMAFLHSAGKGRRYTSLDHCCDCCVFQGGEELYEEFSGELEG